MTAFMLEVLNTIFFAGLGLALLAGSYWLFDRLTPFSITREIQQEKNMAMAVLLGAVFLAIALIVAAVIRS
ncbi:MAG: DUF350 domain-containing protein [Alphaproteobacteria bacterium]|jgi:putative membrane protein|nr:DUF350 domain-containing protein [Alphaproteobacteria bacterium]